MAETEFGKAQYFTNRELSWLDFNVRILEEARDRENPLFERMKFLSITASNLDEFCMVRVASLKDMVHAKYDRADIAGLTPTQQLEQISAKVHALVDTQYSTLNRSLIPSLKKQGLLLMTSHENLNAEQARFVDEYFEATVFPVLTPMAMDSARPFPLIRNKTLNIGALIRKGGIGNAADALPDDKLYESLEPKTKGRKGAKAENVKADNAKADGGKTEREKADHAKADDAKTDGGKADSVKADNTKGEGSKKAKGGKGGKGGKNKTEFATVQVPSVLPRFIEIPAGKSGRRCVILLEQIIERNIQKLFMGYDVVCAYPYRIMRNADLTLDEDEAEDLLKEIEKQLKKRQWGEVIRLEIEDGMDEKLLKILRKEFGVKDEDIYRIGGPLDLTFLMKMYGMDGFDSLKETPWTPQPVPALQGDYDIFEEISKKDILLHHPYMTFDPVVQFVKQAAVDPQVLAIKQTLYRVSGHSPIVAALAKAAENGKQVTVLVELKARFDEENNIIWARMLEKAGCHVIYGLVGLKTHSKITLVVRREEEGIKRYVHLGTGNYNDSTARLYTDCGVLTCSELIGEDATAAFNMLSGYSEPKKWNKLSLAPIWLRSRFLYLIDRERDHAMKGSPGHIIAKMNSLCDKEIIEALYAASAAGVKIELIVRGICCLKVGIPGVSENITVRSLVGTFLEHARIFCFYNEGQEEVFMGSADWMPRNLDRRVEILFPVEDADLKKEVMRILQIQLADNMKARELTAENVYERIDRRGKVLLGAQQYFCEEAAKRAKPARKAAAGRRFVPAEPTG